VRQCYNRNRFVLQTMIDQVYCGSPAAVETALAEVVERVVKTGELRDTDWYIGGSTAAWLLGAAILPHDIDLGTTRPGVDQLAAVLVDYLIEPASTTDWPDQGIVRGARAFVGTFAAGARAEWCVPLEARAVPPLAELGGGPGVARLASASFRGRTVRVARPEYALVRAAERGIDDRVDAIRAVVIRLGPDRELLEVLLERSTLRPPEREELRRSVRA
jgi:hypothetical protein